MPLATTHRSTAANLIVPDWQQKENDGSITRANKSILSTDHTLVQFNGVIGDGPFGKTSGDFDVYEVTVSAGYLYVDVDARMFGSALDAAIDVYDSSGTKVASNDTPAEGGSDPFLAELPGLIGGTFYVVIKAFGSNLANPFAASSGTGATSTGAYRVFISNVKPYDADEAIFHGTNGSDIIDAGGSNDIVVGNREGDTLRGEDGNDLFVWKAGDGFDGVNGGAGYDVQEVNASGNPETFSLSDPNVFGIVEFGGTGSAGGDFGFVFVQMEGMDLRALGGNDTFSVGPLAANLTGTIRFWGGNGNDKLLAGSAINRFVALGEAGNDVLRSSTGIDVLNGGAGKDLLVGGRAADTLLGGLGADRFDYNAITDSQTGPGVDVLKGFSHAQHDRIDLATIDADQRAANPGNDVFTFIGAAGFAAYHAAHPGVFGMVRFAGGMVEGNVNASLGADFAVRVVGVASLVAGDFFL